MAFGHVMRCTQSFIHAASPPLKPEYGMLAVDARRAHGSCTLNRLLLSGSVPWTQRVVAALVWLVGLSLAAALLVFGFFVGAALLGIAALTAVIAWARLRWGKPIFPRTAGARTDAPSSGPRQRTGETIIDAEYVVIQRNER